mmetsp:Transcript_3670/g.8878  ORF Transcript_3670/g.8878 Transcript_3670/m.8878 type:complete len:202 (-) Transcript_3670:49-654(-)
MNSVVRFQPVFSNTAMVSMSSYNPSQLLFFRQVAQGNRRVDVLLFVDFRRIGFFFVHHHQLRIVNLSDVFPEIVSDIDVDVIRWFRGENWPRPKKPGSRDRKKFEGLQVCRGLVCHDVHDPSRIIVTSIAKGVRHCHYIGFVVCQRDHHRVIVGGFRHLSSSVSEDFSNNVSNKADSITPRPGPGWGDKKYCNNLPKGARY